jgi:hypothetical protein
MKTAAPSRLQKGSALALVVVPLAVGAATFMSFVSGQDRLHDLDARLTAQSASIEATGRELAASRRAPGDPTEGLTAPTLPLAGAQLKERVSDILTAAGASIAGFEILSPEAIEAPDRVAVRIAFGADVVALQEALFSLETAEPTMQIAVLDITAASDPQPDLNVALEVESYWEATP